MSTSDDEPDAGTDRCAAQRALHLVYVFGYPLRIGGHFKSALSMASELAARGHRIQVAAPDAVAEMEAAFAAFGASVHRIPELGRNHWLPDPGPARRLLQATGGSPVDVFHAQDLRSLGPAYLAAVRAGCSLVLTLAGGPFNGQPAPARCQTVIFSQELLDAQRTTFGLSAERLHLVPARIDRDVWRRVRPEEALIRRLGLPEDGWKLFIAMRLSEAKRPWLDTLLRAAEELAASPDPVRIVVAGEGALSGFLAQESAKTNAKTPWGPILYPIGPVFDVHELNQVYNHADLVIGSGRGIMEAMASAKPVVILGESGEGELIDADTVEAAAHYNFSGRHFREHPGRGEPLSSLLTRLRADEPRLRAAGAFAYEFIRTRMDARLGAGALLDVYARALEEPAKLSDFLRWNLRSSLASARNSLRFRLGRLLASGAG